MKAYKKQYSKKKKTGWKNVFLIFLSHTTAQQPGESSFFSVLVALGEVETILEASLASFNSTVG